jgi:hypothetical protein
MNTDQTIQYVFQDTIDRITVGSTNRGLFLHRLKRGDKVLLELIEKVTVNHREIKLYQSDYKTIEISNVNVPRLYKIYSVDEKCAIIITEFIMGAGTRPNLTPKEGELLGKYFVEIARVKFGRFKETGPPSRLTAADLEYLIKACQDSEDKILCEAIIESLPSLYVFLDSIPLVFCHNDLNWDNMAIPGETFNIRPFIFDWQSYSKNYLGADLHFFVAYGEERLAKNAIESVFSGYEKEVNRIGFDKHIDVVDIKKVATYVGLLWRIGWMRGLEVSSSRNKDFFEFAKNSAKSYAQILWQNYLK